MNGVEEGPTDSKRNGLLGVFVKVGQASLGTPGRSSHKNILQTYHFPSATRHEEASLSKIGSCLLPPPQLWGKSFQNKDIFVIGPMDMDWLAHRM